MGSKRGFLKGLALGGAALGAVSTSAAAQPHYEWKLASSFPKGSPGVGINAERFATYLEALSGGRIRIKLFGGGELVPPFAVEDAVQEGTIELGHSTPYYSAGKDPALHFFGAVPFGLDAAELNAWMEFGGGQALMDEVYARRGLKPFLCGNSTIQSAGWFRNEINGLDDLKGLNMRIAGLGGEAMRRLGVNAVQLPPGEIFPAMQSGAVDAAEWVGPWLDLAFGLNKVAQYCYLPAFHEPGASLEIVMRADLYGSLDDDLKVMIAEAARASALVCEADFLFNNIQSLKTLEEQGVIFKAFPDEIIEALVLEVKVILDEVARSSEHAARIAESYLAFASDANAFAASAQGQLIAMRRKFWA